MRAHKCLRTHEWKLPGLALCVSAAMHGAARACGNIFTGNLTYMKGGELIKTDLAGDVIECTASNKGLKL